MPRGDTGGDTVSEVRKITSFYSEIRFSSTLLSFSSTYEVMRCAKTVPWIQGRSRVRPPASRLEHDTTSGDRKPLRRSLGQETLPNVLLFRTYVPCAGKRDTVVKDTKSSQTHTVIEIIYTSRFQTCDWFGRVRSHWPGDL